MLKSATFIAILFAGAATAQAVNPAQAALRPIAEKAIADQMLDPESTRFRWIDLPGPSLPGDAMECGQVNAKNTMGGYVGYRWFFVQIVSGGVVQSHVDSDGDDQAEKLCAASAG